MSVTEDGFVIRNSGRADMWPTAAAGLTQPGPVLAAGLDTAIAQPTPAPAQAPNPAATAAADIAALQAASLAAAQAAVPQAPAAPAATS